VFHPQAAHRGAGKLGWAPGWRGSGARPITATPIGRYSPGLSGVPLTGGQALATVPGSGQVTLSVGPQGLGTVWYPTQLTISTTTGALDSATAMVYVGSGQVPTQLVASVFSGNGLVGQVPTQMTPGQTLIVAWSGANPGDQAALNIIGTMDALTTG
jgi:hypothetical protein